MKKPIFIFLFAFYTLGTVCLPLGDFSLLGELPEMYSHCKATEDKDMTPIDFITDHLLNIDGIFDKHVNGDEQKPHKSQLRLHRTQTIISIINPFDFSINNSYSLKERTSIHSKKFILSVYITKIFRPPIV